ETEIVRDFCSRERGGDCFQSRLYKFARRIFHFCIRHLILNRIDQLYVTQRARSLLDLSGYTFIAFAADSSWPVYGRVRANFLFPFRADLAQVISPNVGRPAAVGTMHNYDLLIGYANSWIERCDFWIVP